MTTSLGGINAERVASTQVTNQTPTGGSLRAPDEGQRLLLPTALVMTMTASSFQVFALAVLAANIIEDLSIGRFELGLIGSLNTLVGAVTAPLTGRITDRIGPSRAVVFTLVASSLGMAVTALSVHWIILAAAAVISGLPQGLGNPSTNALIADRVSLRARGTITGIKQSGVQLGIFLAGFTLPGLAWAVGWKGAMWVYAILFAMGAAVAARTLGWRSTDRPAAALTGNQEGQLARSETATRQAAETPLPHFIWVLSLYALLYGTVGGAVGRFFPLWAHEDIGLSTVEAGILVAVSGLIGMAARVIAGRLAQNRIGPARLLSTLAVIGAGYCAILVATAAIGAWVLWPATLLYAVGIGAWNAVAMLAVIVSVPRQSSGRASGVVMFGFLSGLTIGGPLVGATVDRWGSYQPAWVTCVVLSLASALVISPRLNSKLQSDH